MAGLYHELFVFMIDSPFLQCPFIGAHVRKRSSRGSTGSEQIKHLRMSKKRAQSSFFRVQKIIVKSSRARCKKRGENFAEIIIEQNLEISRESAASYA